MGAMVRSRLVWGAAVAVALVTIILALLTVLVIEVPGAGLWVHLPAMLVDGGTLLTIAVGIVAGVAAFRYPTPAAVAEWSRRHAVPSTTAAHAAVQLRRVRAFRTVPAVFGFAIAGVTGPAYNVAIDVLGTQHPASLALLEAATGYPGLELTFGGYLLGVLLAEATRRPPAGATGAARLETRRPGQYLTPTARWLPALFAALVVGALAVAALVGRGLGWELGLVALGVPVLVALAQHSIVRRPQKVVDADALALDDTLRSSAAHALSGGTSALLLAWALEVLNHALAGADGVAPLAWTLPGIVGTVGVYGLWAHYGSAHRGRRPERSGAPGVAEAAAP